MKQPVPRIIVVLPLDPPEFCQASINLVFRPERRGHSENKVSYTVRLGNNPALPCRTRMVKDGED